MTAVLTLAAPVQAGQGDKSDKRPCLIEVLHSEELPFGPLFYHAVKVTLLVTTPDAPPFQTTVQKVIRWQAPPPRQGQRARVWCDPVALHYSFGLF
jgi:hypothetical protein